MKYFLTLVFAMCSLALFAQQPGATPAATTTGQKDSREVKREEREKEREAKSAAFERSIDSMVMAHNFTFLPSSFQMEPAGNMRQISNPNFRMGVYPDYVDIMLPYYRGMTPPYVITVLNYTVSNPDKLLYMQTDHGWEISFETNLYSSYKYTFRFTIYKKTGETELSIDSDFLNEVTYSGTIVGNN